MAMINIPLLPVKLGLRVLPDAWHAEIATRLFNHLMRGQTGAERIAEIDGVRLCLSIVDTGNELLFEIRGGRLERARRASAGTREWQVRIRGKLNDFLLLATRSEDPDSLFFSRRLALEGDTEIGLHVKNVIDAIEFDPRAHFVSVVGPWVVDVAQTLLFSNVTSRRTRNTTK
ncbi:MAG: hypothetical protein B7Z66_12585 [Chromatiales bacterium 21-64-14]|nr:MAG: hypothetical protein B7Z66_12585 [Chromatiales bacterium 21-64-14]